MSEVTCAFCKGKGKDPFELLSELATCQVCGGVGMVEVNEPTVNCAFCKSTGVYPHQARVTCTVCNGKGVITVEGPTVECPECDSTGATISGLPCLRCRGKGVILKDRGVVLER
ncbi:MAG: zinc finger domain-containing protein [Candidatus Zixiibacteriota bacterium]